MLQILMKILRIMSKKVFFKYFLTVLRYAITLLLGAAGSESGIIPPLG